MVSNKRYKYALERWNEWENIATNAVKENGVLLKEMKEINDLSKRINDNNSALIAECRRLREQLIAVTAERDHYLDLLPDVSEINKPAANKEDPEVQWE
jgi:hypothetical protein